MAEIKSTIDLVMEKTKHLVMTSEEKKRQAAMELIEKIAGHVQRFVDGVLPKEEVVKAYKAIGGDFQYEARKKLVTIVLDRLSIDLGSSPLILLKEVLGKKDSLWSILCELEEVFESYNVKSEKVKSEVSRDIREKLLKKGFDGSGIDIVPEETDVFESFKKNYLHRIENLKKQIISCV